MAAHQIPLATFFCVSMYGGTARGIGTYLERFWVKIPDYFCLSTYTATTVQGKYEGMVYGPSTGARDPDGPSYRMYVPDQALNRGYVNDPTLTALLKEQRRTKDLEARKQLLDAFQRYVAEQQYYVYTISAMMTGSWQPYVKNYAPNQTFDYGSRVAALWLDR